MRIGIDLMGSDGSPTLLFQAVDWAAQKHPSAQFMVFVTETAFEQIRKISNPVSNIEFQMASEVIEMDDDPLMALRQKSNSSLILGIKRLKKRELDAFLSAGNTGALIAATSHYLPLLPGIKRPALLALLPTEKGSVAIIDVGGNVACKADHLVQFAQLAVAYQKCQGIVHPRVGLLNIGVESKKGTSEVRLAYHLLSTLSEKGEMKFAGNVEGREVFRGVVDVLVTDGFTGNVLLKTSEGVSSFILHQLQQAIQKLAPEKSQAIFNELLPQFDSEEYDGAIICGVDCVAVKCHGQSTPKGFYNGIKGAIQLVQNGFIDLIKGSLSGELKINAEAQRGTQRR